jgi:hypothetical protein
MNSPRPAPAFPPPPSSAVRREQLRLLCALDRARVRLILATPEPAPVRELGSELAEKARVALPWIASALLGGLGKKLLLGALRRRP